jgi:hypothetical protein
VVVAFGLCLGLGCSRRVRRRRAVEDGPSLLGALGLALGHESFEGEAHDLGRDVAIGVGLVERCGDLRSGTRFRLLGEVAADELDQVNEVEEWGFQVFRPDSHLAHQIKELADAP